MAILPLFEMLQPCVDDFLHPPQLGAPGVAHVVEAGVHVTTKFNEAGVQIAEASVA